MKSNKKKKLAVVMSHPIQYQVPFLRKLSSADEIDLMAYFLWDFGVKETYDPEFKRNVQWDIPILEGYEYKFIKNFSPKPSSNFLGTFNFGIVRELYKNNYDAVLVYGWGYFANWLVFTIAFLKRIPVFISGESPLSQEFLKPQWKVRLKKFILSPIFKLATAILYIGEENKKFYKHYGVADNKLFFMPYAIDNERFRKAAQDLKSRRKDLRKKLGIKEDDVVILFTGKLIPKKRPLDLLKAYQLLVDSHRLQVTPHLIFVGNGELEESLRSYTENNGLENARFVGFRNQTELPEYYTVADIFVLPSGPGETWGLVVNEAMNFSLPVMVSKTVGSGYDLVREGENGFRFEEGNIEELFQKMAILASDKDKRKKFGKLSFEIIGGYSYDKDVETILKALKKQKKENNEN